MAEPVNVIFLDVDGVLNSLPYCYSTPADKLADINEENLRNLAAICHAAQAQIVLSSTWRELKDAEDLQCQTMYQQLLKALDRYEMSVDSITPHVHGNRPEEIKAWLEEQAGKQICFVSLDDDFPQEAYDSAGIGHCLVRTRYFCHTASEGGLQEEHVRQALQKLENQHRRFREWTAGGACTPAFWTDGAPQTNL